jgi:hypothetical protein
MAAIESRSVAAVGAWLDPYPGHEVIYPALVSKHTSIFNFQTTKSGIEFE